MTQKNHHPVATLCGRAFNVRITQLESSRTWIISMALQTAEHGPLSLEAITRHPDLARAAMLIRSGEVVTATGHLPPYRRGVERVVELLTLEP